MKLGWVRRQALYLRPAQAMARRESGLPVHRRFSSAQPKSGDEKGLDSPHPLLLNKTA